MIDYIELSTTPSSEQCTQVQDDNAVALMRMEARAYIAQLQRTYGANPEGSAFRIHRNAHDFGTYLDVRFCFDEDDLEHGQYAMKLEEGCEYWDLEAIKELRSADYFETMETDNGPTGHGDICWSDADPGL